MSNLVEKLEVNLSALSGLLGGDNVEDIKKQISNLIVNAVSSDISYYQSQSYTFYPPDYIKGIAEEAFDEVEKKIKKMYKDAMLDVAERSVEKYKNLLVDDLENIESGEMIMKSTGIVRRIDDLGRVVIPKEIRRSMGVREGDPLEIFLNENVLIIQKYNESTPYRKN